MINEYQLKRYCCGDFTEIENYTEAIADTTQTWECHHRREITEDGKFAYSPEDLIENGEYYNRPPSELIFLTKAEHMRLHHKGKKVSDATRAKSSKAQIGKPRKHFDITASRRGDRNAYARELYHKNKDEINARRREERAKKKALAAIK